MRFKKIMAGVLASAMTLTAGILPDIIPAMQRSMTASAKEDLTYGDYLSYEKVDEDYDDTYDYIKISNCDTSAVSVEIPSEIDGLPVASIAKDAFSKCVSLESVTIPDSVTSIGYMAFYACESLASVTIPDSVTSIGWNAFYGTALLDDQTGVKYADTWVIDCDNDITSAEIKEGTKGIGDEAFSYCTSLESVTIPDSVASIGNYAFSSCGSLASIDVTENNKYYSSIDGVLFNKDKTKIIQYPIGNKNTTYTIPDSVITIGNEAFSYCINLESVTIPDSVITIDDHAFSYCESLASIIIPDSVTKMGEWAFDHTALLNNQTGVKYVDTWVVDYDDDITSAVEIKKGTKGISNNAFFLCASLESITIPDSVTSIGENAFSGCESLKSVKILNPDCKIYDYEDTITNSFFEAFGGTIYGYENSTAQAYAEKYGYNFESIGEYTHSWSVADIISLQNFFMKKTNNIGSYYDLNNDGKLDVFDVIILKRKIIYG